MIDPQQQANKWIRAMEETNNLEISTMSNPNMLRYKDACRWNRVPSTGGLTGNK